MAFSQRLILVVLLMLTLPSGANLLAVDDRRHWDSDANIIISGNADQWEEKIEPGPGQFAVFNHEPPRDLSLRLDADRTWRGLIVDGESLRLNLAGKTLTLTTNGLSANDLNISVGEFLYRDSTLLLSNGSVIASKPILVGAFPAVLIRSARRSRSKPRRFKLLPWSLPAQTASRQHSAFETARHS